MSYLTFTQIPKPTRKTLVFAVMNTKGQQLGQIMYHPHWRRYVFEPWHQPIFDSGCLVEIITKIDTLMQDRLDAKRPIQPAVKGFSGLINQETGEYSPPCKNQCHTNWTQPMRCPDCGVIV